MWLQTNKIFWYNFCCRIASKIDCVSKSELKNYFKLLTIFKMSSVPVLWKSVINICLGEKVLKKPWTRNNFSSFRTTWRSLEEVLKEEKVLPFIMIKTDNCFMISLGFGYALHFCGAKSCLYICNDVTACVRLWGDGIEDLCFDWPQHNNFSSSKASSRRLGRGEIVRLGRQKIVTLKRTWRRLWDYVSLGS